MKNNVWNSVRTPEQLDLMRKSGEINAKALKKTLESAKIGVSLLELEQIANDEIIKLEGQPAFKTVEGYNFATCLNLNDEVVHGLPRDIKLASGDLLSVDIGTVYKGWYSDAAWTIIIGEGDEAKKKFLTVGEEALWKSIKQAKDGNKIGDISNELEQTIEGAGYSIISTLTGHGVGKAYHESPEIPGFGNPNTGPKILSGNTLAIEAIYAMGQDGIYQKSDGWTLASKDGSLTGLFEMTVIVSKDTPEVITDWRKV